MTFLGEKIPRKSNDCSEEAILERVTWLREKIGYNLSNAASFSADTEKMKGNIENMIGICQIPVGIAGPLQVNGDYAKGKFFIPMATTEGVLVSSFAMGMRVLSKNGGIDVKILKDEMHVSPLFVIHDMKKCLKLIDWIDSNLKLIKSVAESTTKHGKLIDIEKNICGGGVILRFIYDTKDAMGMNMINWATKSACEYIAQKTQFNKYYVRSNYSADKKISFKNIHCGYGKEVFASAVVKKETLRLLKVTPQKMLEFYNNSLSSTVRANVLGFNGQVSNGIAAIFIACGQDVAHVIHSSPSTSSISITEEGNLFISTHIPNLLVGTVGGGTALPTQKEYLTILGCYGDGKAKKFAEIIGATVLAGELAICASLTNESFFGAHEKMGRNRPD